MKTHKDFFTPGEIAEKLGICYAKALDLIKYGTLPHTKVGRTYHVKIADFDKFTSGETK